MRERVESQCASAHRLSDERLLRCCPRWQTDCEVSAEKHVFGYIWTAPFLSFLRAGSAWRDTAMRVETLHVAHRRKQARTTGVRGPQQQKRDAAGLIGIRRLLEYRAGDPAAVRCSP